MWIYTIKGMLSIVQNKHDKTELLVRSREIETMEYFTTISSCKEDYTVNENADYPFRIIVKRKIFEDFLMKMVKDINYNNFKDSIDSGMEEYHTACTLCWSTMVRMQAKKYPWIKTIWDRIFADRRYNHYNFLDIDGEIENG